MAHCLIGLGSNQGDRQFFVNQAIVRLGADRALRVGAVSRFYETPAVGGPAGQGAFLNAAVSLETSRLAPDVLDLLLPIEAELGRRRSVAWGPRPIDLDLLLYDELMLDTVRLTIPHPRMAFRRFVLQPAAEIAPEWVHPTTGWDLATLWNHLQHAANYVAIAGPPGVGKTELARKVRDRMSDGLGVAVRLVEQDRPVDPLDPSWTHPSGHRLQAQLESLDRQYDLLARVKDCESSMWSLSDFWFGQSAAVAQVGLTPAEAEQFHEDFMRKQAGVVTPKLRVVLEASTEFLMRSTATQYGSQRHPWSRARVDQMRDAVERCTRAPGNGPMLILDAAEPSRNVEEVTAAILAMR